MVLLGSGGALASICHFLLRGKIRGWGFQSLLEWRVQENAKKKKQKQKPPPETNPKQSNNKTSKKKNKENPMIQTKSPTNQTNSPPSPPKNPTDFALFIVFSCATKSVVDVYSNDFLIELLEMKINL